MNAPLIVWLAFIFLALPVLAAAWRRHALDLPMKLVAAWFAFLVVGNLVAIAWVYYVDPTNNLVVPQLSMPIEATLVLGALAEWQVQPIARTAVRISIPLYWVAWGIAFFWIEGAGTYSTTAGPILGLLVLAAALGAFISHLHRDAEPVLDSVWGWMLPGLAMFFAINATATIVMAMAMEHADFALMRNAAVLRAWIYVLATLMITWGFLWPTRHRSSGSSSSPPPSR